MDGTLLLPTDDSGVEPGPKSSSGSQISRFALSSDNGKTWVPQNGTIRGHHGAFVELRNGSIWGIGRNDGIK